MNSKRAMLWSAVSGILGCALALSADSFSTIPELKPYHTVKDFPKKLTEVIALTGGKEVMRCINQDPKTYKENYVKILGTDGEVKLVLYSNKRLVSRVTSFYQQQQREEITCQSIDFSHLKSVTELEDDGKTVHSSRAYALDGSLILKADRDESDGGLKEFSFLPGKKIYSRQRFWDKNDVLWLDEHFYADGTPRSIFSRDDMNTFAVDTFFASGVQESHRFSGLYQGSGWALWSDERTMQMTWKLIEQQSGDYTNYHIQATYFDQEGVLDHYRTFNPTSMMVSKHLPQFGIITQEWYIKSEKDEAKVRLAPDNYWLKRATMAQYQDMKELVFVFAEPKKGGYLESIEYVAESADHTLQRVKKILRPDGFVDEIELRTYNFELIYKLTSEATEGGAVSVPGEATKRFPYLVPDELPRDPVFNGDYYYD